MDRLQVPGSQVRRRILQQIRCQDCRPATKRPGPPGRNRCVAGRTSRGCRPRDPGGHQRARENPCNDRHQRGNVDPHAQTTQNSRQGKPATAPPAITHSCQQREQAPQGADARQPVMIWHARKESRRERKSGRQSKRKQPGSEGPEPPRNKSRRPDQRQPVQQRIRKKRGPFHREADRPARNGVIDPRDEPQPPAVRRGCQHFAAEGCIVTVDVTNPPFLTCEHLLGLRQPAKAGFIALRHDQLPLPVRITGRGGRIDNIHGPGPAGQAGDILDPLQSSLAGPDDQAAGTDRCNQPDQRGNPGKHAHSIQGRVLARRSRRPIVKRLFRGLCG